MDLFKDSVEYARSMWINAVEMREIAESVPVIGDARHNTFRGIGLSSRGIGKRPNAL